MRMCVLGMLAALAQVVQTSSGWHLLRHLGGPATHPDLGPLPGARRDQLQGLVCGRDFCFAHHPHLPGRARAAPAQLHTAVPTEAHHKVRLRTDPSLPPSLYLPTSLYPTIRESISPYNIWVWLTKVTDLFPYRILWMVPIYSIDSVSMCRRVVLQASHLFSRADHLQVICVRLGREYACGSC